MPKPTTPKILGEPPWLVPARGELGQREIKGGVHNPRILEYHATTKLHATTDEVHWCSSLVNWVFAQVGIVGTLSAAAISWATWGIGLDGPVIGCVAVVPRHDPKNKKAAHVGLVVGITPFSVLLLAGNQGNMVSIRAVARSSVKHYRWPVGVPVPA